MTDGDALLRAILENPADDTARLVYADWLEENGNAPWARFIRHQIWTPVSPCRNAPLTSLLSLEPLVGPLPHQYASNVSGVAGATVAYPDGKEFWFRRGLVADVRLPLAAFLMHAESLFRSHPIERAVLTDVRPSIDSAVGSARRAWLISEGTDPEDADPAAGYLPPRLYERLSRMVSSPVDAWNLGIAVYPDEASALADLSAACVAHGRALAGLSPLPAGAAPWA